MRWLFVIILILAIIPRFYRIGQVPLGLNWDEVSIAYNAWSIALWHRDEKANFMPLSFVSFGDYKPPGLIYLLAIPYFLFGFHLEWVRYMSAIMGVGSVILGFLIAREFRFKNIWPPYLVMLFMALSPWAITLSRVGYEQNTAFFLVNLGVLGLLKGRHKPRWWLVSSLAIILSLYVFHTAKVFWLGMLPLYGLIYFKEIGKAKRTAVISLLFLILMSLPLMYDMIFGFGATRSNTLIGASGQNVAVEFFYNLINQLSIGFWLRGVDAVSIRHAVPGYGVLTVTEIVGLITGLILTVIKLKQPLNKFLLGWFAMGLMPALITSQTPHVLRSLFALTPTVILSVTGGVFLFEKIAQRSISFAKVAAVGVGVIYGIFIAGYFNNYYGAYAQKSATAFQYGYKEVLEAVKTYYEEVDKIKITDAYGQPYIYVLAYNQIRPQDFLFGALNKYEFGKVNWGVRQPKQLYVGTKEEIPPDDPAVVKTINIPGTDTVVWVIAKT